MHIPIIIILHIKTLFFICSCKTKGFHQVCPNVSKCCVWVTLSLGDIVPGRHCPWATIFIHHLSLVITYLPPRYLRALAGKSVVTICTYFKKKKVLKMILYLVRKRTLSYRDIVSNIHIHMQKNK